MFRKIDDLTFVAPQIAIADVAAAHAQGIVLIINNRPDGEEPDAPQGADIAAAARAAGMGYVAIPVTHAGFSQPQVDAMLSALDEADGPVLAYCRSGTRSTLLWALASAKLGEDKATLQAKAAGAGYDLSTVEPLIDMLAAQR
jgi:uncharacterized protein (TIGR01244 family)